MRKIRIDYIWKDYKEHNLMLLISKCQEHLIVENVVALYNKWATNIVARFI